MDATLLERDRALFTRLQADAAVIGEVYDVYADAVYGFLVKRCGHQETAEDIVSQTFIKLLESRTTLEWKNVPLSAWLFQVASNALMDHFRKASTRRETDMDEGFDPPSNDDPAWNAEVRFDGAKLRDVMKDLSDRDQQVLDLRFFAGLETQEIAAQLNIDGNHAAVLLYRAIGRLRKRYLATHV